MSKLDKYYEAKVVALALNFSEQIGGANENMTEDELNKIFLAVFERAGYAGVDLKKLDRSIEYFLTDPDASDVYSLPEYSAEMPSLDE